MAIFFPTLQLFVFVLKSVGSTAPSHCVWAPQGGGHSVFSVSGGADFNCKAGAPGYLSRIPICTGWRRRKLSRPESNLLLVPCHWRLCFCCLIGQGKRWGVILWQRVFPCASQNLNNLPVAVYGMGKNGIRRALASFLCPPRTRVVVSSVDEVYSLRQSNPLGIYCQQATPLGMVAGPSPTWDKRRFPNGPATETPTSVQTPS